MEKNELKALLNDHDLMIAMNTKLDRLITDHANHLHHHWASNLALLTITFMSITTALIALFIR